MKKEKEFMVLAKLQNKINKIRGGDIQSIKEGLTDKAGIIRLNALLTIIENNIKNDDFIENVKELKNDDLYLNGYTVSQFANAALDRVWGIKYTGDDRKIHNIIKEL